MTTLGTKLARLRSKKGYSQQEVADRLEVSQPAYHKWESDEAKPGIENIIKLSRFFEIEINDLLDESFSQTNTDNKNSAISIFGNTTVTNNVSENILENIMRNQDEMVRLMAMQNKLIEALLKK